MADIRIERKSNNIWPWVIGILVLLLIVAAVFYFLDREGVVDVPTADQTTEQTAPGQPNGGQPAQTPNQP